MAVFTGEEALLLDRLRSGEEAAFVALVDQHSASMLHVARRYVHDAATAEEVVQETWLAVLNGIAGFQGRCSIKSWIFSILMKRSMTRGKRDSREVPFSSLVREELADTTPSVPPERFAGPGSPWPRHWENDVPSWPEQPDGAVLQRELRTVIDQAIITLPPAQRAVVELRDISGHDATEVAQALEISDVNARVLLHRGRSKIRAALEAYFLAAA